MPFNLDNWVVQDYNRSFNLGDWRVENATTVTQNTDSDATLFCSDFSDSNYVMEGKLTIASTTDDDTVGWAFGYDFDEVSSNDASYLLVSWKRGNQAYDWGTGCGSSFITQGMRLGRVLGIPDIQEFWSNEIIENCSTANEGVEEIVRGPITNWKANVEFPFRIEVDEAGAKVYIAEALYIDYTGTDTAGRFCFYALSQDSVTFHDLNYTSCSPVSDWIIETYGDNNGPDWELTKLGVTQRAQAVPSLICSDFMDHNYMVEGTVQVGPGDDDFVGWAVGYDEGDITNEEASYYLIDWKRAAQGFDWGTGCDSTLAKQGLALSHVMGVPDLSELWGHVKQPGCASEDGGLEELVRSDNVTYWQYYGLYNYTVRVRSFSIEMYIDDVLQFEQKVPNNTTGRFCYYTFSQDVAFFRDMVYTSFDDDDDDDGGDDGDEGGDESCSGVFCRIIPFK